MQMNRLNLRNVFVIAICLVGITVFSGCDKEKGNDKESDFYNLENRVGLWINSERKDTLEFVNSSELIRKGGGYGYQEYLYRIEEETLIISTLDSEISTYHPILESANGKVVIGNMYITTGFANNSGTFEKK